MSTSELRLLARRIDGLVQDHQEASPQDKQDILQRIRRAAKDLDQECLSPAELEADFHFQPHQNACVRIAIELGIFDVLPLQECLTCSEIAARLPTAHPEFTIRIVRALCACRLLLEEEHDNKRTIYVRHTRLSKIWHARPKSQAYARHQWDNMVGGLSQIIPFLHTYDRKSPADALNSPFAFALGAKDVDFFTLLQQYPDRLMAFNQGMTGTATDVVGIYPWETLLEAGESTVCLVDVGGGKGHNLQQIISAHPGLQRRVVLQDLPGVIDVTEDLVVDLDKVKIQPYNFLQNEQPVTGAAAYLYKSIFHDWPDSDCRKILRNLVTAMQSNSESRLLICDLVVDQLASKQPFKVLRDVNMMVMAGRERTVDEWEELLLSEGFKIARIWGSENLGNSIIEARLNEPSS